jgi:hypothetical protein
MLLLWVAAGPFSKVEGAVHAATAAALSGHDPGGDARRAGPTADVGLEQKAAANRQVIAITRQRLTAGEDVPRMYQEPGLAGLERQGEVAEALVAERQAAAKRHR